MSDSIYGRLKELGESDLYSFHMPGHKRHIPEFISGDPGQIGSKLYDSQLAWYSSDITEITGFDNLHFPENILRSAQNKACSLYHSDEAFYLINGSTAGILSAVSALCLDNKRLLISRNSHLSVYHAAYINRLALAYVYPQYDEECGFALGIGAADIDLAIKENPDIGAVLITSPTYEGIVSDIAGIAKVVHRHNMVLIVDEAHGAHFGFHPAFPENAVSQGADIVVHSLHKTLPALTQTALLNVCGTRVDRLRLKRFLRIFQSSSPSYPLMAGIERCLDLVKEQGFSLLAGMLKMRAEFIDRTGQLKHVRILDKVDDPCKIVIVIDGNCWIDPIGDAGFVRLTGGSLFKLLHDNYLLEMEMAADNYVIAIFTMMDKADGIIRLANALNEIDRMIVLREGDERVKFDLSYQPEAVLSIYQAYDGEIMEIQLDAANGYIAAEFIAFYPPGQPFLIPGERIDRYIIDMMLAYRKKSQTRVIGLTDSGNIRVLKARR